MLKSVVAKKSNYLQRGLGVESTNVRLMSRYVSFLLFVGILLPPVYVFVMIQYGAITVPYWDHLATAKQIIQYFDGNLTFLDLFEPQSQARPLIPRLIFILNAVATDWDIRSEFIYIILTIYGVFGAVAIFVKTNSLANYDLKSQLFVILLLSIFCFSPVAATNHDWSLMLIGTLSYFFTVAAFLTLAKYPLTMFGNGTAAIFAWLSSFSISQGLLIFPIAIFTHQIISSNRAMMSRWSLFWLANMIFCYAMYFPHLTDKIPLPPHPSVWHFLIFIPVYIGSPLGSLLLFPNLPVSWHSLTNIINLVCGIGLLAVATYAVTRAALLRRNDPESLIVTCFSVYAVASSILTAWGRANGPTPIYAANSSRYAIFASLLILGLIIYFAKRHLVEGRRLGLPAKIGFSVFIVAAAVSYGRSVPVYVSAHNDNLWLKDAYLPQAQQTPSDSRVYPDEAYLVPVRADLLRLGIGPYRLIPEVKEDTFVLPFMGGVELQPKTIIRQHLRPSALQIRSISFQLVSWGKQPSKYRIHWSVARVGDPKNEVIKTGFVEASSISDWMSIEVRLSGAAVEHELEVSFFAEGAESVSNPVGVALYKTASSEVDPVLINDAPRGDGSRVGISITYAR